VQERYKIYLNKELIVKYLLNKYKILSNIYTTKQIPIAYYKRYKYYTN